ncbi:MAG: permease [Verrucomicrobia bacterium]|nr:permease [Verrucomicrobiota bacterium]
MADEMQAHLDGLTERNVAAGMSPEDARYSARRTFGGVEQIKERAREERRWRWAEDLGRDLRTSFRSLRRAPAFSGTVIATLALCIGANTAITTVLYEMVLRPLPFHDAGQVVEIYNSLPNAGQPKRRVSAVQYRDYQAHADLLEKVALFDGWMFNFGDDAATDRLLALRTTADYFSVMGVQPLVGRFFTAEESVPGRDDVAVLTQTFWEQHFHADQAIVGQMVRLSRRPFTIVGVAPRSLEAIGVAPVLLVPMGWSADRELPQRRLAGGVQMYARIKPGVSYGTARAQLDTLEQHARDAVADPAERSFLIRGGHRMVIGQLRAEQTKSIHHGLFLLQGAALLVLLLGCVNVASLMLARANARQVELAVRRALGAGRVALARQLFTEAALLAVSGGALGLALAWSSLRVINTYTAAIVYGSPPVTLDGEILGLTFIVSMLAAVMIGVLPVLQAWRMTGLQAGSRGSSRSGGIRATSAVLVTTQVALALVLLVGAGLLVRSFSKVMAVNPGFDVAKVIHTRVALDSSYKNVANTQAALTRIMEKMREIPGVESAAYSSFMPGYEGLKPTGVPLRGMASGKDDTYPTAIVLDVSPEFLPTMGVRLLDGRNFTAADLLPAARKAYIIDRKFAERYFPGRSAVGQLVDLGAPDKKPEEAHVIVGVAESAKFGGLDEQGDDPYVYSAMSLRTGGMSIELRTSRKLEDMLPLMRAQVRSVDSGIPIYQVMTMQMQLDEAGANRRGVMWLLGAFAGIALILSAVGLCGMLAYDVTQRTREIGIRGAIGATRGQIVALILRQGLWRAGVGLVLGLGAAFFLTRYMGSLLYEVNPDDPLVFSGVALTLLLVALFASWLPARRAAQIDPIVALRSE